MSGELHLERGHAALAGGDIAAARASFTDALAEEETPAALDGLAQAQWWSNDGETAITTWERAYAVSRRSGDPRAARVALRLSREYVSVFGNDAAARGWLSRADDLLRERDPGADHGWLAVTRAQQAASQDEAIALAGEAVAVARRYGDADLEVYALAALGRAKVTTGAIDEGMEHMDAAMAAATGGEVTSPQTIADICCSMVVACEIASDPERIARWSQVVQSFISRHDDVPLFGFCPCCAAEILGASGRIEEAEQQLVTLLPMIDDGCQVPRCVHPASRLASIRIMQGRLEEAAALLQGQEHLAESFQPQILLYLARGQSALAEGALRRRLEQVGASSQSAPPLLFLLGRALLETGDLDGVRATAAALSGHARGRDRLTARSEYLLGLAAAAAGMVTAIMHLQRAAELFGRVRSPIDVGQARLALARAMVGTDLAGAIEEGKRSLRAFEEAKATRDADAAAAFLRDLGVAGRTGAKGHGDLTAREEEVLRLVALRLSNAQIAERLFLSVKTVGNHVSSILMKLGVSDRGQAAAWAADHLPGAGAQR